MSFAHHSLLLFNPEMCVIVLVIGKALLLRSCLTPPAIEVDGVPEFEVHSIMDSRIRRRKLEYLVDWVGYDAF